MKFVPEERERDPWRANRQARHRRLREAARRPPAENLIEGLAVNARGYLRATRDVDDLEALEASQEPEDGMG